ncbi:MAG: hypothetical protein ACOYB8_07275 [Eubacteriaceae bacterium]|jgi:hypothetical protein
MKQKFSWKAYKAAVHTELREHKSSFMVYWILRLLVVLTLIRQAYNGNYESVFMCALTLILLIVPSMVSVSFHVELPAALENIILLFIFAAEILGEINEFYIIIPFWDTILHTINGFICAAIGFSLAMLLNNDENLTFSLSPFFLALVAFCFSMTVGVLWEFFECFMDLMFHTDMQKDTILHTISSVMLNPAGQNKAVMLSGITDVKVNGQDLNLGGYLDIGLYDTMKDLFVNFIGALVFSFIGYHYAKTKGKGKIVSKLVPTLDTDQHKNPPG